MKKVTLVKSKSVHFAFERDARHSVLIVVFRSVCLDLYLPLDELLGYTHCSYYI